MESFAARDEVARQSGVHVDSPYFHWESDTGLALNAVAKTVTVADGSNLRTYAFDDVCEWASRSAKSSAVAPNGCGLAGAAEASGAALFVSVKGRDCPTWRVAMHDKASRARWLAILSATLAASEARDHQSQDISPRLHWLP